MSDTLQVTTLKLSSGVEIIGRVVDTPSPDAIAMERARVINSYPDAATEKLAVDFAPYMVSVIDGVILFHANAVEALPGGEIPDRLVKMYLEATTSIQIASGM